MKRNKDDKKIPTMLEQTKSGWNLFSEEVAWFIHDFFRFKLNDYEKLIFYCYYINGMTLMEIAKAADCSFQNIGVVIKKVEKKLQKTWEKKEYWRVPNDHQ